MSPRQFFTLVAALSYTVVAPHVFAQEPPAERPDPEESAADASQADGDAEAAQQAHVEGTQHFAKGDFVAAADAFRRAYEAFPAAEIVKSEIVARFKAKQCPNTETLFQNHAEELGGLPEPDQADLHVIRTDCALERARTFLKADDLDSAEVAVNDAKKHDVTGRKAAAIVSIEAEIETRRAPPEEVAVATTGSSNSGSQSDAHDIHYNSPTGPPPGRWQRISGWAITGMGTGFLLYQSAINLLVYPPVSNEFEAIKRDPSNADRTAVLFRRLDNWANREETFWIVGGVLTVGGLITVFTAPTADSRVAVGVGPSGITFTSSF